MRLLAKWSNRLARWHIRCSLRGVGGFGVSFAFLKCFFFLSTFIFPFFAHSRVATTQFPPFSSSLLIVTTPSMFPRKWTVSVVVTHCGNPVHGGVQELLFFMAIFFFFSKIYNNFSRVINLREGGGRHVCPIVLPTHGCSRI